MGIEQPGVAYLDHSSLFQDYSSLRSRAGLGPQRL
jgi:hypothetical protein